MKYIVFIFCLLVSSFWYPNAFATVGGPSLVSDIYYNDQTNTYRYALVDGGGRGGSKIYEYNMDTNVETQITQGSEYFSEDGWFEATTDEALRPVLSQGGATMLQELQLSDLPISFDVRLTGFSQIDDNNATIETSVYDHEDDAEYFMPGFITEYIWSNRVLVNGYLQRQTELTTCRLDQINYRGYGRPGQNFVVVITSVSKSDCWEGGYVGQTVFPVKYVDLSGASFLQDSPPVLAPQFDGQGLTLNRMSGGIWIDLDEDDFDRGITRSWSEPKYSQDDIDTANYLADQGLIVDRSDNPFRYRLDDTITRAEVVGTALKLAGVDLPESYSCQDYYTDVTYNAQNNWICRAVEIAADQGMVTRSNTRFRPQDEITRAEAFSILYQAGGGEFPYIFNEDYTQFYYDPKDHNYSWEVGGGPMAGDKMSEAGFYDTPFSEYNDSLEDFGIFIAPDVALNDWQMRLYQTLFVTENIHNYSRGFIFDVPIIMPIAAGRFFSGRVYPNKAATRFEVFGFTKSVHGMADLVD